VFTADVERGYDVAARVRSGTFDVNEGYIMDPAAPFGGLKWVRPRTRYRGDRQLHGQPINFGRDVMNCAARSQV